MFSSQPYTRGQRSQQHQRGSYRPPQHQQSTDQESGHKSQQQQSTNQDSGYKKQQSDPGRVTSSNENLPNKSEAAKVTSQNVANKPATSGSQSAEVKTCVVNPFIPLQVNMVISAWNVHVLLTVLITQSSHMRLFLHVLTLSKSASCLNWNWKELCKSLKKNGIVQTCEWDIWNAFCVNVCKID